MLGISNNRAFQHIFNRKLVHDLQAFNLLPPLRQPPRSLSNRQLQQRPLLPHPLLTTLPSIFLKRQPNMQRLSVEVVHDPLVRHQEQQLAPVLVS